MDFHAKHNGWHIETIRSTSQQPGVLFSAASSYYYFSFFCFLFLSLLYIDAPRTHVFMIIWWGKREFERKAKAEYSAIYSCLAFSFLREKKKISLRFVKVLRVCARARPLTKLAKFWINNLHFLLSHLLSSSRIFFSTKHSSKTVSLFSFISYF